MKHSEAEEYLKARHAQFYLYDFCHLVQVRHQDGTVLSFTSAVAEKVFKDRGAHPNHGWLCVWTEHHGSHCFYLGDLDGCAVFTRVAFDNRYIDE